MMQTSTIHFTKFLKFDLVASTGTGTSKLRTGQLVQGVVISVDKKRGAVGLKADLGLISCNMVLPHITCFDL